MVTKPDPTTTTACGNCGVEERRLIHHVRHRGSFRHLCTTCVLRLHPQSFCPTCFQVYPPTPQNDAVVTCSKCYSSSHSECVAKAGPRGPTPYTCLLCVDPNSPIFRLKTAKELNLDVSGAGRNVGDDCGVMDADSARKLVAAAKIALASMNKAAAAARAEAERRAKEAAYARKRAREALEHLVNLAMRDKLKKKEEEGNVAAGLGRVGNDNVGNNGAKMERGSGVNDGGGRNGSVVIDKKFGVVGCVDRVDASSRVLAALNAVELGENDKVARGEGLGVSVAVGVGVDDCRAGVSVDENGGGGGEGNRESGGGDHVMYDNGAENLDVEELDNVDNEVVAMVVESHAEDQVLYKENDSGAEQHANGGTL